MKIFKINIFNPYFQGQRQDRKNVAQLQQDNEYDLNVPNQRKISQSIENLSKIPGESNVNFLLDVAENLKYGTNIDLDKKHTMIGIQNYRMPQKIRLQYQTNPFKKNCKVK